MIANLVHVWYTTTNGFAETSTSRTAAHIDMVGFQTDEPGNWQTAGGTDCDRRILRKRAGHIVARKSRVRKKPTSSLRTKLNVGSKEPSELSRIKT